MLANTKGVLEEIYREKQLITPFKNQQDRSYLLP